MGRAKVTLKCIQNEKARAQIFKGRMRGLNKKMTEFHDKCKVDACLIVYECNGSQPITWPHGQKEVRSILEKYEAQKKERSPKSFDLEDFFENRKNMVQAEISKVRKEIVQIKYPTWNSVFKSLDEEHRMKFITMLDTRIVACNQRIDMLKNNPQQAAKNFSFGHNMAQSKSVFALAPSPRPSPSPIQLNLMQNSSQIQLIPTPVMPLNHNNQLPHVVDHGMGYQSQMSQFDPNFRQLVGNNNVMVGSNNEVVMHLGSTKQNNGAIVDPTNQFGEFMDMPKFGEYENWTSQPTKPVDWASQLHEPNLQAIPSQFQNVPQPLGTLPPTMDEILIYDYNNMFEVPSFDNMYEK